MIEFEPLKSYYRHNKQNESTYKIFILSRKNSGNKTIITYTVTKYNMQFGESDYDIDSVDTYTSVVYYDSGVEVLYIKEHKIIVSADMIRTYVAKYKEYIHNLITNRYFLKEEIHNIEEYIRKDSIKGLLIALTLECLNDIIETDILHTDIMDSITMLITLANSLMADIEISHGIHFHKSKVFLSNPVTVVYNSQLSKFMVVDIIYNYYKDSLNTDTRKIIENLITTYLTLT